MSSPFYQALPVYLPFSGTVDANGNFKTTLQPRAAFWVSGKVVPKLSIGSGVWEVNDGGAIPLGFGRGQRSEIGSIVVPPNASVVVNLTGGVPGAAVSGSFQGVQHPDMASLASRYAPLPNITTLEQTAVRRRLGTVSTGPNSTSAVTTFNLSAETRSVGLQALIAGNLTNVNITGAQSGTVYYNVAPSGTLMEFVFIDFANDTAINVTITAGAGGTSPQVAFFSVIADDFVKTWVQGSSNNQTVTVSGQPTVDVSDRAARLVGVVQEGASPPLWQAPNQTPATIDANIGAGATIVIIGAVANQALRLFGLAITAGATVQLQDTASPTPNEIGSVAAGATWAANFVGANVRQGSTTIGFQIKAPGAAASVNGMVSFSQG